MRKLFGDTISYHKDLQGRNLCTTKVETTKQYLRKVEEGFHHQKIFDRAARLLYHWTAKVKTPWEVMKRYESLDREIYSICRKAEKECRATHSGKADWSPSLDSAIKQLSYWRARLRYKQENMVIQKLGIETGIQYERMDDNEIKIRVKQCRENLDKVQKNSVQIRQKHLESRAEQYAKDNNLSHENAVRELLSHESIKTTFLLLRDKLKDQRSGLLQKIWIARDDQGNFIKDRTKAQVLETKEEVHHQLLIRNKKHLRQAKKTPFARTHIANKLKWDSTGFLGEEILNGNAAYQSQRQFKHILRVSLIANDE